MEAENTPGILQLPQEVMELIFQYLSSRDLLHFRSTSSSAEEIFRKYIRLFRRRFPMITLSMSGNDSRKIDAWRSKPYFPFSGAAFNSDNRSRDMAVFSPNFGQHIKNLNFATFYLLMTDLELEQLKNFVNIEVLTVSLLALAPTTHAYTEEDVPKLQNLKPTFMQLKEFKFTLANDPFCVGFILKSCPNLLRIEYGRVRKTSHVFGDPFQDDQQIMKDLTGFIREKRSQDSTLFITFGKDVLFDDSIIEQDDFISVVSDSNVEINMLPICIFVRCWTFLHRQFETFTSKIVGVNGFWPILSSVFSIKLKTFKVSFHHEDYLDDSSIDDSDEESSQEEDGEEEDLNYIDRGYGLYIEDNGLNWPYLETVDIELPMIRGNRLSTLLFEDRFAHTCQYILGPLRPNLKSARIWSECRIPRFACLRPNFLGLSCANLVQLKIQVPFYGPAEILELFETLGQHTSINSLHMSVNLKKNERLTFGELQGGESFLTMTGLRHFSLSLYCDKKQDLTNWKNDFKPAFQTRNEGFFCNVLAQSHLTCLKLENCFPVTHEGLKALSLGQVSCSLRSVSLFEPVLEFPTEIETMSLTSTNRKHLEEICKRNSGNQMSVEENENLKIVACDSCKYNI